MTLLLITNFVIIYIYIYIFQQLSVNSKLCDSWNTVTVMTDVPTHATEHMLHCVKKHAVHHYLNFITCGTRCTPQSSMQSSKEAQKPLVQKNTKHNIYYIGLIVKQFRGLIISLIPSAWGDLKLLHSFK